ncbi:50S ribosomal protein L21e [Halalkalicoccus paucihalophilus]|jgi:large subunit ribosomal protein L21e|uniref:Large ribosomal subunit protein eL21 n=1 Tax=Halalkalicoccus paucihalophilus TaxID=1008153 RepID=A0A151AGQ8_9EURY|nr:50S ribosomal protein L21e [Halalkalicoccus paucihalophilus]KYH26785.1 50S ribosomal protein L21e [Halalkalicoccus paucihalophilus]MCL7416264.1 50S ribosomal protein L21e [Halalkalicoccus sp.]
MPSSNGPLNSTRKKLSNHPRERGTSPPQRAVARYEEGQRVHLKIDPSVPEGRFHPRFNGHTGVVAGKQGTAYKVEITDGGKRKTLIAKPAHLRAQE